MHFFLSINAVAGAKAILLDDFYLVMIKFLLPQRLFVSESGARSHSLDSECFIPLILIRGDSGYVSELRALISILLFCTLELIGGIPNFCPFYEVKHQTVN